MDAGGDLFIADTGNNRVRFVPVSSGTFYGQAMTGGYIYTIAGNGTAGFGGDGGLATSAELNGPQKVAVDSAGDVFIADSANNRVRELVASSGVINTVAGNGTAGFAGDGGSATSAELSSPEGVSVDSAGDVFIADTGNNRVREVTASTGAINTVAGGGPDSDGNPATQSLLDHPYDVAVDSAGDLFIPTDDAGYCCLAQLHEVTASNGFLNLLVTQGPYVSSSSGVAVGPNGSVYFPVIAGYQGTSEIYKLVPHAPPGHGLTAGNVLGGGKNPSMVCLACAEKNLGDPVTLSTGNLWETSNDLSIPGRGLPLSFSRTYNSTQSSVNGPLGYGWTDSYNLSLTFNSDSSITVNQENASQVTFTPNGSGGYTAPSSIEATLVHNQDGTYTFTRRATQFFTFDSTGRLTAEKDLNGYTTTITYPSGGQEVITDPAGRTLTLTLSGGLVTQLADSAGRSIQFGYNDGNGDLTDVIDANGGHWQYVYNSAHQLLMSRSARFYQSGSLPAAPTSCTETPPANFTANVYDTSGRVICQWDPDGRQTNYDYTSISGSTKVTDPKGNVSVYAFQYGLLYSETHGYGTSSAATTTYFYDPYTLGITETQDPNNHVSISTYDSQGNQVSHTDALGRTTTWTYNAYNEMTSKTAPATYGGQTATTTYTYDQPAYSSGGAGDLTTVSTPILSATGVSQGTQVTHYVHGDSSHPGDVTSMIDPGGNTWTYTYDTYGDKTSQTAPATSDNSDGSGSRSNVTKWVYNTATGWMAQQLSPRFVLANPSATTCTTPAVGCTTYTHDNLGRVLVTTDGDGHTITNHYDADGNLDYSIDGNNDKTTYTRDAAEQVTVTTRADNTSVKTNYWPDGTVEDQIDATGADTHYTYDALGHLSSVTDPDNRVTAYTYDGLGNLLVKGDPGVSGCTTSSTTKGCTLYTYDAVNELIGVNYNDPGVTPNITAVSYDSDGRRTAMTEQVHGSTTNTVTSTWSYDSLGRVAAATDINGSTVGYGYDNRNDLTAISYPSSTGTVTRAFDAAGRLQSIIDWRNNTTTYNTTQTATLAPRPARPAGPP